MKFCTLMLKRFLPCAVAAALLIPAPAFSAPEDGTSSKRDSIKPAKKRAAFTVRKQVWKGYGFLPGYPKTERERRQQRLERLRSEPRYYTYYGGRYLGGGFWSGGYVRGPQYGFGPPGFVRGQWNGGSIGPCYTQTPIGFVWNCGM
jgi:hypothetical protein